MDLSTFWFCVLGFLLAGYAVLDGYDLGVGILHPIAKTDEERRILMNSIGPLWDGNEVWLVAFGASFFAAFPDAYAAVFSGFYAPFMLLLPALVLRAASLEFRGKRPSLEWRRFWDRAFFGSSALAALLFGVAAGNLVAGVPVDSERLIACGVGELLRPFPLLSGILTLCLFAMHGACYLCLKTEGGLQARCHVWRKRFVLAFMVLFMAALASLAAHEASAASHMRERPFLWAFAAGGVLIAAGALRAARSGRGGRAFAGSCIIVVLTVALFCGLLYPDLAPSSLDEAWSLDAWNSASSQTTLRLMAAIALVGIPLAVAYSIFMHLVFRGKVELDQTSY
ncbi:MAG: cytochrome d ubiquinol oxidase subunit II [Elusimicrobia bacterium]|nr:cytochrome d ubiquinol oxidase subunit II [Elusimicrobiota bacterium]